jgi:hypothetical protein
MSQTAAPAVLGIAPRVSALGFVAAGLSIATAAALLAGWMPLRFSIVTVFLFAGPHNWLEARYFLTRLPGRFGKLRGFFTLAFAGIAALTAGYCALLWLAYQDLLGEEVWLLLYAGLHTLLILWIATLAHLRSKVNPRRDWGWVWPAAFACCAVAWLAPDYWGLGLVYLHPLLALWLLDRELKRVKPSWRPALLVLVGCLPLFLAALWWRLAGAAPLPADDDLGSRIADHAGASLLPMLSSHLLVATHTFLEMLHYGVWVVAIPLIGLRVAPWRLTSVPLAHRGPAWRAALLAVLMLGAFVVVVLWACFLVDYATTRTVYFAVAMLHVLAEFPFLLRSL